MRVLLPLLILLSACAPLKTYYRPGVTVAKLASDTTDCEVKALAAAPVVLERVVKPPEYTPPQQDCDGAGNCVYEPGYWEPGHTYTIDLNRDLRKRVETQCMARLGYAPVSVPQCPKGVEAAGQTRVLPKLSERSCVIRKDGGFLIVDRP